MFDLEKFISEYVVKRPESMFLKDIEANKDALKAKIEGKTLSVVAMSQMVSLSASASLWATYLLLPVPEK